MQHRCDHWVYQSFKFFYMVYSQYQELTRCTFCNNPTPHHSHTLYMNCVVRPVSKNRNKGFTSPNMLYYGRPKFEPFDKYYTEVIYVDNTAQTFLYELGMKRLIDAIKETETGV